MNLSVSSKLAELSILELYSIHYLALFVMVQILEKTQIPNMGAWFNEMILKIQHYAKEYSVTPRGIFTLYH